MKNYKIALASSALIFSMAFNVCQADPLPKDSPEYKQLEAMGYNIRPLEKGDETSIARNGDGGNVGISKNGETVSFSRSFTRKNLGEQDEYKLLKIVNQINLDLSYQVSLGTKVIIFARFQTGPYNAAAFASQIRLMEKSDTVFNSYPTLLGLLNADK